MTGPIAELCEDALACLTREHPEAYAAMESALGARQLDLAIDEEEFMLELTRSPSTSVISIATDVETLSALVEGERAVLDAILDDRLAILASPDDLIAVATAMQLFMQGALRCVSMPAVFERLVTLRKERM